MPNPQTMGEFARFNLVLTGACTGCSPARDVRVDNAAVIERYGPDMLMRDVAARLVCTVCRKPVRVTVKYNNVPGPPPTLGYAPQRD